MKFKNLIIIGLFLVCLLAGTLSISCGQTGAKTIKVGAILSITGRASFLGAPEEKTLTMLVDEINAAGGVGGSKIKFITRDSQAIPENAVSFAKQLIEEEKVLAIIGPSTSGESMHIKNICEENNTILLSCAAAETIVDPVARYVFKIPQKDSYAAIKIFQTMNKMKITKIGAVAGNTGFGNGGMAQLEKYAPELGIEIVIAEKYDANETDLTGILTKVKNAGVQAVVNWSIVPAQSIIAKNMKQLHMDVPLFQSHGFGNIKYVEAAGEAAEGIIFPCGRLLVAEELPDDHPQKAVLVKYKKDYESRYKEAVSSFGGCAYDALMILVEAVKKANSTDVDKVRDAIETVKDFPGTCGIFNFSPADHNGLSTDSFEMLTIKNGTFAILE